MSVATCSTPPSASRSATRSANASSTNRRLMCRCFGHGSGKNTCTPASDAVPSISRSSRRASPSRTRTLVSACASSSLSRLPWPGVWMSTASTSRSGSAAASSAVASPMPKPISSRTGAVRPNSAGRTSGTPSTRRPNRGHRSSSASCWVVVTRPARRLNVRMGGCGEEGAVGGVTAPSSQAREPTPTKPLPRWRRPRPPPDRCRPPGPPRTSRRARHRRRWC